MSVYTYITIIVGVYLLITVGATMIQFWGMNFIEREVAEFKPSTLLSWFVSVVWIIGYFVVQ